MKLLLAIALVLSFSSITTTAAAEDLPAPPSPSPTPAVTPASPELVAWAKGWRTGAARRLALLNRARACFNLERRSLGPHTPARGAGREAWLAAGRAWKAAAADYRARFGRLRYRMAHPGGSGWERWRPLIRWHWPAPLVSTAVQIVRYESGGNPSVRNYGGSGAAGLFQLLPAPDGWANPDTNVWYAYHRKYVPAGGWSPWAGCAAF